MSYVVKVEVILSPDSLFGYRTGETRNSKVQIRTIVILEVIATCRGRGEGEKSERGGVGEGEEREMFIKRCLIEKGDERLVNHTH